MTSKLSQKKQRKKICFTDIGIEIGFGIGSIGVIAIAYSKLKKNNYKPEQLKKETDMAQILK